MQQENLRNNHLSRLEDVLIPLIKQENPQTRYLWGRVNNTMLSAFKSVGLGFLKRHILWRYINRKLQKCVNQGKFLGEIERELRPFFEKRFDFEKIILPKAKARTQRNYEKIKQYLIGEKILDLGAGDGLLGELIKTDMSKEVILVDVVDYNYTDLPLLLYKDTERIPLEDNSVSTCIMYTVLHHADDPEYVLKEASRVTAKRMVIMEGYIEEYETKIVNSFIDWFINRVVRGTDINVPLNYKTKQEWNIIFEEVGFKITKAIDMGIDEPVAPEHHILYILDRFEKQKT